MSLKDIDTFIQYFIQKSVQVIVQSRLGTERTQTKCNPNGMDWFNLDINNIKDITDQTVKCLKLTSGQSSQNLYFLKQDWKICCEISLQNSDGISLALEYWIFSNIGSNYTQEIKDSKLSQLVHQIFTRMSNMIKSLIVLTRSTLAFRLSSKGQSADSYVICYRIYQCDDKFLSDFMNKSDQSRHYSQIKLLGSIKSHFNELSISLIYRTDMNINSESEIKNIDKVTNNLNSSDDLLPVKDDHFKKEDIDKIDVNKILKPINPAFAEKNDFNTTDLDTPFKSLLSPSKNVAKISQNNNSLSPKGKGSKPISIPTNSLSKTTSKSPQIYSTSNDSFVFVELNAPFAPDDRELNLFFHGPSPTFLNNSVEVENDINELNNQLAELESDALQIDSFVESICLNENEELKFET